MLIKDKVIAITGGGRGLGRSMALAFADKGGHVALLDLNQSDLDETCAELRARGVRAEAYLANVAREDEVSTAMDAVVRDFGRLDVMICNAGITRDALLVKAREGEIVSKMTLEQWNAVIGVNLTGVFLCGREAAERMIRLGNGGVIINISSISRAGNMGQTNYSAAKAGVAAMAVAWARELARYGIRVASIAPGFIGTEMVMAMKPEARDKLTAGIPLGRIGDPDEIAATVQFILENDYVSGRCFDVDGGLRL